MSIKFKNQWYKEAIENLNQYNKKPFIYDFMDLHNIDYNKSMTKSALLKIIKKTLKSTKPPSLFDLTKYLDELKLYGKQHIFLYKLHENQQKYLDDLRNPQYILRQLRKMRFGTRFNNEIFRWNSVKPKLVVALHFFDNNQDTGYLQFKWVETRRYFDKITSGPIPIFKPRKERSVNFFIINLEDGSAELRIQSIKNYPDGYSIESKLDTYKQLIGELLDFHLFSPILLESVIKTFLIEPILPITSWSSLIPNGLKVGEKTIFIMKFIRSSKKILSKELNIRWKIKQRSHGRKDFNCSLNGRHDAILYNAITDKSKVDFTINQLKKLSQPNIENKELDQLSKRYPEYTRIIQNIDYHLIKLDIPKITAKKVAKDILYSANQVKIVFQLIAKEIPRTFYIKTNKKNELSITNRFSIKGGLLVYFKRWAYNTKWEKWIKPIFTLTGILGPTISHPVVSKLIKWIMKELFNIAIPQGLTITLIILCAILIVLLQFGFIPVELIQKLSKIIGATANRVGTGIKELAFQKSFDREYKEYLTSLPRNRIIDDEIKLIN